MGTGIGTSRGAKVEFELGDVIPGDILFFKDDDFYTIVTIEFVEKHSYFLYSCIRSDGVLYADVTGKSGAAWFNRVARNGVVIYEKT